jgi:multimeric flavodoxin WrbA
MPTPRLPEDVFKARYREQFFDPAFDQYRGELEKIAEVAWQAYKEERKSPVTRKAGPDFADPDYDLSVEWLAAREAIHAAQKQHETSPNPRVLIVNGSPRNENTCPSEMSKSWRMLEIARTVFGESGIAVETLDLSRTVAEYGRNIHPCKACYSTAAALCHWPCSCYPNNSLGQTQDWMNDIYPMWVRAHGVMLITPVHWYQATSPMKLMMDRLVCGDGGNPDPSSTHGKKADEAKALELAGWDYPRHLEGRLFGVVVHGDTEGTENVRRSLVDWLTSIKMVSAGPDSSLDRYIGYWKPYATSHVEYEQDFDFQAEVRNVAKVLAEAVKLKHQNALPVPGSKLEAPREK